LTYMGTVGAHSQMPTLSPLPGAGSLSAPVNPGKFTIVVAGPRIFIGDSAEPNCEAGLTLLSQHGSLSSNATKASQ